MNAAIRKFIQENYQPWRSSPEMSLFRGKIGAEDALPFDQDALDHFTRRGIPVEGRLFEDLIEGDLLDQVALISSWLPDKSRHVFDDRVAFGLAATQEANAVARSCLDGYAILFDDSFRTLLANALEIFLAYTIKPQNVTAEALPLTINTAISFLFFHAVDPLVYMKQEVRLSHEQQELASYGLWFIILFFLAHEGGHIMLGHLSEAPERGAVFRSYPGLEHTTVLEPASAQEFAADEYAIELLFEGERRGGLIKPGADRYKYWNGSYMDLGQVFSIIGAIELLAARIGFRLSDTHPPARERWQRVAQLIRDRIPILPQVVAFEEQLHTGVLASGRQGPMPSISKEMHGATQLSHIPGSVLRIIREAEENARTDWVPSTDVLSTWMNCTSSKDAKAILETHPEMLHPKVEALHIGMAKREQEEQTRFHILIKRLLLLRRCREIGIDAAFEELGHGPLGMKPDPSVTLENNSEKVSRLRSALAGMHGKRIEEARQLFEPADLVYLEPVLKLLVGCNTAEDMELVIVNHPEIVTHPAADLMLAEVAAQQHDNAGMARIELFRMILARCREVSVFRAILEARAKFGF